MKRFVLLLPALAGLTLGSTAAPAEDQRITTRLFRPDAVVTVPGRPGVQTTVAFGDDERIENIAVGDSAAWQVTPNKRANLLFIKPASRAARTNMTVVTDRRAYLFDLVAGSGQPPVYLLRFTYPAPPPEELAAAKAEAADAAAASEAAAAAAAALPPAVPPEPAPTSLDFAWTASGARQLYPLRSFSDGRSVYLAWPRDVALPAILVREPTGEEAPVNFSVKNGYIVVDGVPPQLVLRSGKRVALLTAGGEPGTAPAPAASPPAAGPADHLPAGRVVAIVDGAPR